MPERERLGSKVLAGSPAARLRPVWRTSATGPTLTAVFEFKRSVFFLVFLSGDGEAECRPEANAKLARGRREAPPKLVLRTLKNTDT